MTGLPFWIDIPRPSYSPVDGPATAAVAIVGAGIAGLKLARCLARRGLDVVVLEAGIVGDGASGRNQGTINHGPGLSYAECIGRYGRARGRPGRCR